VIRRVSEQEDIRVIHRGDGISSFFASGDAISYHLMSR